MPTRKHTTPAPAPKLKRKLLNANYVLVHLSGVPFQTYRPETGNEQPVVANNHWVKALPVVIETEELDRYELGSSVDFGEFIADREAFTIEHDFPRVFVCFSRYEGDGYYGIVTWTPNNGLKSDGTFFKGKRALDQMHQYCFEIFKRWENEGMDILKAKLKAMRDALEPKTERLTDDMDLIELDE